MRAPVGMRVHCGRRPWALRNKPFAACAATILVFHRPCPLQVSFLSDFRAVSCNLRNQAKYKHLYIRVNCSFILQNYNYYVQLQDTRTILTARHRVECPPRTRDFSNSCDERGL
jgi:hypothetical protein